MTDEELIRSCLEGDENAFTQLVHLNEKRIYYHCLSIVKDEEAARDLTQETFLHAFMHLNEFQMRSRFSTWVWRIAHNLALNYLKKNGRKDLSLEEEMTPAVTKKKSEFEEDVVQRVHLLPEKYRTIFTLYYLEGMPQKEIAAHLNIPHGTVRSRLYTARKKLRILLEESNSHDED